MSSGSVSLANAFAALHGSGGEQAGVAPSSKKKAKKKPAKPKADAEQTAGDAGPPAEDVLEQASASAILEQSARTYKAGADRIKLWRDWLRQAAERGPKALKYRAPDGSIIPFTEVLLRSRALEITVEGCVTAPLTPEQAGSLQQLLAAFIPAADAGALASSITRLGSLLAEDTQGYDTIGAAQRAVHNVVATLKAAKEAPAEAAPAPPATLMERLSAIDREAGKQHGFLASVEKLAADPSKPRGAQSSTGVSKAHVNSAAELVKLYGQKFDLLTSSSSAAAAAPAGGSGPSQATVRCLQELKAVIRNHLKEASAIEESVKGAKLSAEAQRAQAVAALRREEAVLASQAADLAGQIRLLESQLAQVRGQAAEVEDKRSRLQQRQAAALEALSAATGRKLPGLSAQHYEEELSATDQLLALVDPSHCASSGDQLAAAQAEHGGAAESYMAAVRALLQMSSSSLADVPGKVEFCRQRIAQAEKLSALGNLGKEKSAKTREEANKLLDVTVAHVGEVLRGATAALEGMRARFPSFSAAQQAGLSQAAYEIEDMAAYIRGQHELAMAAVRGQAPPAVPPPGAAPPAYGGAPALGGLGAPPAPLAGGLGGAPIGAPPGSLAGAVRAPGAVAPVVDGPPPAGAGFSQAPGGPVAAPQSRAGLGPIQPPAAKAAAASSNGHAPPAPTPAARADGFQTVGGKKNRRKA